LKPRYDGRWRPEMRKARRTHWSEARRALASRRRRRDLGDCQGPISISNTNSTISSSCVATRTDYNSAWSSTTGHGHDHVIRGDDHVNTPGQINIFKASARRLPRFGHIPMILGAMGKLSKRHGAVRYAVSGRRLPAGALMNTGTASAGHGMRNVSASNSSNGFAEAVSRFPAKSIRRN